MVSEQDVLLLDIESVPLNREVYEKLTPEERKKLINPIDSKVIAIGLKTSSSENLLFGPETEILATFWKFLHEWKRNNEGVISGFNIKQYDLPFLITRSFVNNIKITPIALSDVLDLREVLSFFRYGRTRGTMKDFARALSLPSSDDGEKIAEWYFSDNEKHIKKYLRSEEHT